jgi:aryl-alcohol dehydrogenase-like predicted oxidoreductase
MIDKVGIRMNHQWKRKLGRSGIEVSALGLGCWAIGGPFILDGIPDGWGNVDDTESIKAINRALELGVTYLDTADAYGVGHSEEIVGKAISHKRSEVVIATKFGYFGNESTKTLHGTNVTPGYIERACEASLKRLNTDYIDLYQLHVWDLPVSEIEPVCNTLDQLVEKGKIRAYGWSTDLVGGAKLFAERAHCSAILHTLNVFMDAPQMVRLCEDNDLASINRSPLAMGFLSGKFSSESFLSKNDVRGAGHAWVPYFKDGKPVPEFLRMLNDVKEILTSNGRTLTQGALAWIWGKSGNTIPIPGFKTVKQVEENAKAMEFGPLKPEQMNEIDQILKRVNR